MPPAALRKGPDTNLLLQRSQEGRRWLAVILLLAVLGVAWWTLTRDTDWAIRRRIARTRGLQASNNGDYPAARAHFEAAIAIQPYDWETHLSLATLLCYHLHDDENALKHYLSALAYAPENFDTREITEQIDTLRLIRAGFLENPAAAVHDMFIAVEAGAKSAFYSRLSPKLRSDFPVYWNAWILRGRGTVTYQQIVREQSGYYQAVLTLEFPDRTSMSMQFHCPVREIWRLDLSFP